MSLTYAIFGLAVQSNIPIPGLTAAEGLGVVPDVRIELGISPIDGEMGPDSKSLWYESSALDPQGKPALRIWQLPGTDILRVDYFDGMKFWLDRSGSSVWALWPEDSSLEVAASYLLGPILGLVLRLRGITCLHASAINIGGYGVAFVGPPGAGKSTTAAALAKRGHAVLSDDIVAIIKDGPEFRILPAYPHLCLWPDSAAMLFGSADALPPLAMDSEKRRLSLGGENGGFQMESLFLRRVYVLGKRRSNAGPFLESLPPQEALMSLVSNTYAVNLPLNALRAQELGLLAKLLSVVPVGLLRPHLNPAHLNELCDCIERDSPGQYRA